MLNKAPEIAHFFIAGINYKKTDASIRSRFAIGADQYEKILDLARSQGLQELFILSTCNRTEIYGLAGDAAQLISLLCAQTAGTPEEFAHISYYKQGLSAMDHLFQVAAGLDSQILGDYEIVGQLKQAVKFARERGFIGAFLDRLTGAVLQSSKVIKNKTALSGGTVSVSFAAVQYIKAAIGSNATSDAKSNRPAAGKKILLIGTGKIGRNTCRNLVDYLEEATITLINRTPDKAADLALETGVAYAPIEDLAKQVAMSDIILVATNATQPTLLRKHLEGHGEKLIIDLSIPFNVEKSARELPNIHIVDVDELSSLNDETLQKREAEVPRAKAIIADHLADFQEWHDMRRHVPLLKAVKTKLQELHTTFLYSRPGSGGEIPASSTETEQQIQKVINGMATRMRQQNRQGCHYIEAINEYIGENPW